MLHVLYEAVSFYVVRVAPRGRVEVEYNNNILCCGFVDKGLTSVVQQWPGVDGAG